MPLCHSCELLARRDSGKAPLWDNIFRGDYWDVVHAYNASWLGWLVLVARRHIAAIDEMTEAEAMELGILLRQVSQALKRQTGCAKTYAAQFAEAPTHPHVHFHVMPRRPAQAADDIGVKIFRHLGVCLEQRVSEDQMTAFASGLRRQLEDIQASSREK